MKRKPGELRYDFCARRIMDLEAKKEALKPRIVHVSSMLVPSATAEAKKLPIAMRELKKVKVRGTYRKPVEEVKS